MLKNIFRSNAAHTEASRRAFRDAETKKYKLFLSVGAMKASTSWMFQVLATHPNIKFTLQKELHYFAHKYGVTNLLSDQARIGTGQAYLNLHNENDINVARWKADWVSNFLMQPNNDRWFLELFDRTDEDCYLADFSNLTCFIDEMAWQDILSNFLAVKVLYTMRNPLQRLWSHAKFHITFSSQGQDSIANWKPRDIEKLIRQDFMWKNAQYSKIVKRLMSCIPEENLKISFVDDIFVDERAWLNQLENFLDLPNQTYSKDIIQAKINVSERSKMPDWFVSTFSKDVNIMQSELVDLGFELPKGWHF